MTPAKLSFHDITVSYGSKDALDRVTLDVLAGEIVGLLGPNGSGKTTLLRVASRAQTPDQGSVRIEGEEIRKLSFRTIARRIAVVPQTSVPILDYTAAELVLMGRSPHQGRWGIESQHDHKVAHEAMQLTNTLPFADRSAATLSGGEYQRVLIARALAQEPEILLLDEPTAHLDLSAQIALLELLRRLNRERGLTLLAVLHDLNLASSYCNQLALLMDGRLVAMGNPEEVLTEDSVRKIYGAEVLIRPHPHSGRPMVIPMLDSKTLADSGK